MKFCEYCGSLNLNNVNLKAWRNGSVSDSRSAGWGFKSLCLHFFLKYFFNQYFYYNKNICSHLYNFIVKKNFIFRKRCDN